MYLRPMGGHGSGIMLTDRLMHIHVHRTGGFLVRAVLRQIPGLRIINDHLHLPYERMAEIAQDYLGYMPPAITFVRNPWAWYVSMWGCIWWYPNLPFVGTFREYMEAIRDGAIDDPNFVTMTEHWKAMGADKATKTCAFENIQYWLWLALEEYADDLLDGMRGPEHRWSLTNTIPEQDPIWAILMGQPRFHPSLEWPSRQRTRHYSHYYDAEMRRWVEGWDGELIERFGYRFERDA